MCLMRDSQSKLRLSRTRTPRRDVDAISRKSERGEGNQPGSRQCEVEFAPGHPRAWRARGDRGHFGVDELEGKQVPRSIPRSLIFAHHGGHGHPSQRQVRCFLQKRQQTYGCRRRHIILAIWSDRLQDGLEMRHMSELQVRRSKANADFRNSRLYRQRAHGAARIPTRVCLGR